MIEAVFSRGGRQGFEIRGHATPDGEGEDAVCAAVSSAAYLTANTLTEVFGVSADIEVEDGYMSFYVVSDPGGQADKLLAGLKDHYAQLCEQYPDRLTLR